MNPYIPVILDIISDIKNWILGLIGGVTVLVIAKDALVYQSGDSQVKAERLKHIKGTIMMGGGVFILIWIATYIIDKFSKV